MEELLIYALKVIHVLVSALLILVVLLQPSKSDDLGSVFGGGGSSESVFGASGAVPFLSKVTRVLAVLFLLSSLALGYYAARGVNSSVITDLPAAQETDLTPASDVSQPAETDALPDTSEGEAAPEEASQESGDAAPQQGESQMSGEPDTSGNEQPAQDNPGATQ